MYYRRTPYFWPPLPCKQGRWRGEEEGEGRWEGREGGTRIKREINGAEATEILHAAVPDGVTLSGINTFS